MILNNLIILIYIYLSNQLKFKNGVYNIMINNYYLSINKLNIFISENFKYIFQGF